MTAAAKRMLPLGLWARLLVRLWLARLLLRTARPAALARQNAKAVMGGYDDERGGFRAALFLLRAGRIARRSGGI